MAKQVKKRQVPPTLSDDNPIDNLSPSRRGIVKLLLSPRTVVNLALTTKRKAPNICRDLKILQKSGLVEKDNGAYKLTNFALSIVHYHKVDGDSEMIIPSKKGEPVEMHNISFTLKFWSVPDGWDRLRMPGVMFGLGLDESHYNFPHDLAGVVNDVKWNGALGGGSLNLHLDGYTVACMAPSVKIWLPTVIADSPEDCMIKAMNMLLFFTPKLERWLRLPVTSLYSQGRLNIRVSSRHIVLLKSVLADSIVDVLGCNQLVVKAPDGKEGFILDKSHGEPEFENVNIGYGVDPSDVLCELEKQYGSDRLKQALHEWAYGNAPLPLEQKATTDLVAAQLSDVTNVLTDFSIHLSAHTGTAKANLVAAKELNKAISRFDSIIKLLLMPFNFILYLMGKK